MSRDKTEIEKRIEEELESIWNGERNAIEYKFKNFDTGFKAGAKFIIELPELREVFRLVKVFYELGDDTYCTCGVELGSERSGESPECLYHEAKESLSKLKALGIVESEK